MDNRTERIEATRKFAEGLDNLFKEFYNSHKPPYFLGIGSRGSKSEINPMFLSDASFDDGFSIHVHNGLYCVFLMDIIHEGCIAMQHK